MKARPFTTTYRTKTRRISFSPLAWLWDLYCEHMRTAQVKAWKLELNTIYAQNKLNAKRAEVIIGNIRAADEAGSQ